MKMKLLSTLPLASLAAALLAGALAGCAPLLIGSAVGSALMVTDRRSTGSQIDDETIELRASARLNEAMGDRVHVNVTSYNRQVLLTGETPTEALRQQAEQIVSRVDNVRTVINELAIASPTTLPQRSGDVLITGRIRASFVDAADLHANSFKVVTERGTVYLLGRVTQREAERATNIARQTNGVQRVVRAFEIVTAEELRAIGITVPNAPLTPATVAPVSNVAPATPAAAPAAAAPAAQPQPQPPSGAVTTPVR
jgi:osmotically-inducible protein OsmY